MSKDPSKVLEDFLVEHFRGEDIKARVIENTNETNDRAVDLYKNFLWTKSEEAKSYKGKCVLLQNGIVMHSFDSFEDLKRSELRFSDYFVARL